MHIDNHWLAGVRQLVSPNQDARPDPEDIALILIHSISLPPGEFGSDYVGKLFQNQLHRRAHPSFETLESMQVSSHLFIDRSGGIIQFVPFHRRAWHAGVSSFQGRSGCNDFSIGIELEGDDYTPYTEIQYSYLAGVIRALILAYETLSPACLAGHSDVAPGRKTDPGPHFDWNFLRQRLLT